MKTKKKQSEIFNDYESFVDKFKPKKTTDDCYTPSAVYDAVRRYVGTLIDLSDKEVVRPFYPGGDYENYDYPENAVVIDNPPFSIITKIVRFYHKKGIKFFLFSPHLTLMSAKIIGVTYIVTNTSITYQNGGCGEYRFYYELDRWGYVHDSSDSPKGYYGHAKERYNSSKIHIPTKCG